MSSRKVPAGEGQARGGVFLGGESQRRDSASQAIQLYLMFCLFWSVWVLLHLAKVAFYNLNLLWDTAEPKLMSMSQRILLDTSPPVSIRVDLLQPRHPPPGLPSKGRPPRSGRPCNPRDLRMLGFWVRMGGKAPPKRRNIDRVTVCCKNKKKRLGCSPINNDWTYQSKFRRLFGIVNCHPVQVSGWTAPKVRLHDWCWDWPSEGRSRWCLLDLRAQEAHSMKIKQKRSKTSSQGLQKFDEVWQDHCWSMRLFCHTSRRRSFKKPKPRSGTCRRPSCTIFKDFKSRW